LKRSCPSGELLEWYELSEYRGLNKTFGGIESCMEKELDLLLEHFKTYKSDLEKELELNPDDEFLKGKIKGIQHGIVLISMYNNDEKGRHQIDVIIDAPIMQNTSKEYDATLEKIMEMDPMIRKANEKLMQLSTDPEFINQVIADSVDEHYVFENKENGNKIIVYEDGIKFVNSKEATQKLRNDFKNTNQYIKEKFKDATHRPE
jgi:hypothetical protein